MGSQTQTKGQSGCFVTPAYDLLSPSPFTSSSMSPMPTFEQVARTAPKDKAES